MQSKIESSNSVPNIVIEFLPNALERKKEIDDFIATWFNSSPTIELKTSGSTGSPKVYQVEKKYLEASAQLTIDYFELSKNKTVLHCLSTETIAGKMMIIRSILAQLKIIVGPINSNPIAALDQHIDFSAMVPLQVQSCLDNNPEKFDLLECLIIGGAPINQELWDRICKRSTQSYQTYGMTETYSHIALRRISEANEPFELLPGITIDEASNLILHAPHLGIARLETNDIIQKVDSTHFYWIGRSDFTINSGGIKINPEQIENELSKFIINPFFVYGIKDDTFGQKLILCIEGDIDISKERIVSSLPKFQRPKEIYFFNKFHYTESGKIDRLKTIDTIEHASRQVL